MKKKILSFVIMAALSVPLMVVAQDNVTKKCCKEKKEKCEKKESKDNEKAGKTCCANKKESNSTDKKEKENCVVKKESTAESKSCGKKS
ncbi:MAG: hypothetical protein LBC48_03300 [Dysgonamonadaceae bacterium]|jgi:hypothetical protein|nr:hypothetical protein [Dysgonamonadaceae bacterium]